MPMDYVKNFLVEMKDSLMFIFMFYTVVLVKKDMLKNKLLNPVTTIILLELLDSGVDY